MKRRYKPGDWFAIPLDASTHATGVITHAASSRLFGHFFAAGRETQPPCAAFLFSGIPLEDLRWPFIAAPVFYDAKRFPLPELGERGAFARSWYLRTLDPRTLQTVRRAEAEANAAMSAPPAQILHAADVEARLRELLLGVERPPPAVVCEVREPLDRDSLRVLDEGGTVQISRASDAPAIAQLALMLSPSIPIALRLHGMVSAPLDLRALAAWPALRELHIETERILHPEVLAALPRLQRLYVNAGDSLSSVLASLPQLRALGVHSAQIRALPAQLCELEIVAGPVPDLAETALRKLIIAHVDRTAFAIPETLQSLELRDLYLDALPDLSRAANLTTIVLRGVRGVTDLRPLMNAPSLREAVIEAMPQLHVDDFRKVAKSKLRFEVALGNRTMTREVYRLLGLRHGGGRACLVQ